MTLDLLIAWLCWATFALALWVLLEEIARSLPVRDPVRERREHEERERGRGA